MYGDQCGRYVHVHMQQATKRAPGRPRNGHNVRQEEGPRLFPIWQYTNLGTKLKQRIPKRPCPALVGSVHMYSQPRCTSGCQVWLPTPGVCVWDTATPSHCPCRCTQPPRFGKVAASLFDCCAGCPPYERASWSSTAWRASISAAAAAALKV